MSRIARVLLPLPLPEAFDYMESDGMALSVGDQVTVPLGPRILTGVVTDLRDGAGGNRPLKPVLSRRDEPPLPPKLLKFIAWAARYAVDSPGGPLAMALRGALAPKPKPVRLITATGSTPARMTSARTRVLAAARTPMTTAELARTAGVSPGVVKGLIDDGALAVGLITPPIDYPAPDPCRPSAHLNPSQAAAAEAMKAMTDQGFRPILLDGVTGSGKTEVYLEAIAAVLAADPCAQILVLLPEIALTQAVIARFTARFGAEPGEWHSAISPPLRRRLWQAVAKGRCNIVVGARSALFLPFAKLKLIIVDEEHDGSYKQEEGFIYHARDLAVARAKIEDAAVVLASATPSLESLHNAQTGRYAWLRLSDRHGEAQLPQVSLVDMRAAPPEPGRWLSPPLIEALATTLQRGEQSLLFLNRRGYAPLVLCRACGERMTAPDTDSWLVEHRHSGRLVCHFTGFSMARPKVCPHCGAADSLVSVGPGVERVEEEVRGLFPNARVAVFSSDTVSDAASARALIEVMTAGEIDILVATQAAAKGHNFPNLTLVGVVDADLSLRGGDLRAGERTWQLLAQVAGRAGRPNAQGVLRPGRALLQTYMPGHPVLAAIASGDREGFSNAEMAGREAAGLPPFGRLAALILSGADGVRLENFARQLAAAAPRTDGIDVFGPADAPLALVRGRRRKRFLVRANRDVDLQAFLTTWIARARTPSAIRLTIDVDPYSFL